MSKHDSEHPANDLRGETSAYLQQHVHNPVDWHPWGPAALKKAEESDRPLIVSIGYAACHWCHVMERESFSDPDVAAYQNEHFVSIKVDREERPDVDRIYMLACQMLTRQGGWPLNVFCLPDGRPFYAGTYFPPKSMYRRPSWSELLRMIREAWEERRDEVEEGAAQLAEAIRRAERPAVSPALVEGDRQTASASEIAERAVQQKLTQADRTNGGFGGAPKFPSVMSLELLLAHGDEEPAAKEHVLTTLTKMADGGIYDHLGGGFHRYSVDATWSVPHFEKMLYDNGLLLRLSAEAHRVAGSARIEEVIVETATYLDERMSGPEGAYFATEDADSDGREGSYYVWDQQEIREAVGDELGPVMCRWFGVTQAGNFEGGKTVLARSKSLPVVARLLDMPVDEARQAVERGKARMLRARQRRNPPATDRKRVTSWNGLAIQGLARSGVVLGRPELVRQAARCASFLVRQMREEPYKLYRVWADAPDGDASPNEGVRKIDGFLDDYADLALGLLDLYCASGDELWARSAGWLVDGIIGRFFDADTSELTYVPAGGEALVVNPRSAYDDATPSGVGSALLALQRVAALRADTRYDEIASTCLQRYRAELAKAPTASLTVLRAAELAERGVRTVVVAGADPDAAELEAVRTQIARRIGPDDLIVMLEEDGTTPEGVGAAHGEGRDVEREAMTFFACVRGRCAEPTDRVDELSDRLASLGSVTSS